MFGLFVGSGLVEAGCQTVIATQLKRSGMLRTVAGANDIILLVGLRPTPKTRMAERRKRQRKRRDPAVHVIHYPRL